MRHLFQSVLLRDVKSSYKQTTCWALYVCTFLLPTEIWQVSFWTKLYCAFQKYNGICFKIYVFMKSFIDIDEFLASFVSTSISPGVLASRCLSVCVLPACLSASLWIYHSADSPVNVFLTKWSQHWMIFLIDVSQRTSLLKRKIIYCENENLLDGVNTEVLSSEK